MNKKLFMTLTLAFAMSASTFAQTEPTVLEEGGTGPYKAVMYEVEGFSEHTVFAPKDLSVFNEKKALPVLVWGNGGCANSPRGHEKFLNDIASYGYLVLATGIMPKQDAPRHQEHLHLGHVVRWSAGTLQLLRRACHLHHDMQQWSFRTARR